MSNIISNRPWKSQASLPREVGVEVLAHGFDPEGHVLASLVIRNSDSGSYDGACLLDVPTSRWAFVEKVIAQQIMVDTEPNRAALEAELERLGKQLKQEEQPSPHYVGYKQIGKRYVKFVRMEVLLSDLLADFYFKTLKDTEEILVYGNGHYQFGGEVFLKEQIEARINDAQVTTAHVVNEVIGHIQRNTYVDRSQFNRHPDIINLRNGLLHLKTRRFTKHSPSYLSTIILPVEYNPKAQCPRISQFFKEVLYPQDIPVIEEMFGYCLIPDYRIQRAFLLLGDGANGKTTLIELLRAFLGKANCATVSLQNISSLRSFYVADLYGKLANLYSDIPSGRLKQTGAFKMLTGGDTIPAEKKFKDPFQFRNFARLIFSSNKPPEIENSEDSLAFWRRWVLIAFPNTFRGADADKHILDKLTTPSELSGLLNVALAGLARLQKNGDFSYTRTVDETAEFYLKAADTIYAFIEDCCEPDPEGWVSKDEVYKRFLEYCDKEGIPKIGRENFGRKFKNARNIVVHPTREGPRGKQEWGWRGVRLIHSEDEINIGFLSGN